MLEGEISVNGAIIGGIIGQRGAPGTGISSIVKTGTSGLVDTYTITYTNGDTQTYTITNGAKGDKGDPGAVKFLIVAELPTTGIEEDTIYLVPITPDEEHNNYEEYIYVNGEWELLGKIAVHVDLTDYVKNTDYANSSTGGVIKVNSSVATDINNNGLLYSMNLSYGGYGNASNTAFISKGTLENVITGKGLVSNTDYATSSVGGVIKTASSKGTSMSNGILISSTKTYETYQTLSNDAIIGKGTLENVITGKDLTTKAYVDGLVGDINTALDNINGESI